MASLSPIIVLPSLIITQSCKLSYQLSYLSSGVIYDSSAAAAAAAGY